MPAGRPQIADPGTIYSFAHQFYWDFRRIAEGRTRVRFDKKKFARREERIKRLNFLITEDQKAHIAGLADEQIRNGSLSLSDRATWVRNAEESELASKREWMLQRSANACRIDVRVPGEPDVITDLLRA